MTLASVSILTEEDEEAAKDAEEFIRFASLWAKVSGKFPGLSSVVNIPLT